MPRSSMSRCRSIASRFPQRYLRRATTCRCDISRFCKRWFVAALYEVSAVRAAATSSPASVGVTANDILRAAGTVDERETVHGGSDLLNKIVLPAMADAEREFGSALAYINVEDMVRNAQALGKAGGRGAVRP